MSNRSAGETGDVIFIAPYCSTSFEVGEIIEDRGHLCHQWVVKFWGIRRHPTGEPSILRYGQVGEVAYDNAWTLDRQGEAISRWLDSESRVRG